MIKTEIFKNTIVIDSFIHQDNSLILNNKNNESYLLEITNGTINANIKNCQGEIVGINYLEKGDKIKVKGIKSNSNKFIIKKIYVSTKYTFNSDSSEEIDLY